MNASRKSISQQRMDALKIATKIAGAHHQSTYSAFEIIFTGPDGQPWETTTFVIPLEAAVALEEAGFEIKLVGRLNGPVEHDHPNWARCGSVCPVVLAR